MKSNLWAKTILSVYRYLERISGAIDKMVERQALNSYYYFSGSSIDNGILSVSKRIIELSERKVRLINLKVLTEKALKGCDKILGQILIEKYIEGESSDNIAESLNLSPRTYFRRLTQAEEQFLNSYLAEEKWILDVYKNFSRNNVENFEDIEQIMQI